MGKKAPKSARKYAQSGQLKKTIQARQKHQQHKKKIEKRRGAASAFKGKKDVREKADKRNADEVDVEEKVASKKGKGKAKTVDDILGGDFSQDEDDEQMNADDSENDSASDEDDESSVASDGSFASVDDLEGDEGESHLLALSSLAEKDPEFYKYLQENDRELLNFDPDTAMGGIDSDEEEDDEEDAGMVPEEASAAPVLTNDVIKKWQKSILETRSLRALRKLLIAFRSAAHMNEDDALLAWRIDSASVYNKVLTTAFRYTPIVLEHHVPYKTLPNGKFKTPTQTPKFKTLQKLVLSYFHNATHVLSQLPSTSTSRDKDGEEEEKSELEMIKTALGELPKIVPYVMTSRKSVKMYLKKCLDLWSSADDTVRMAAFLAMRKLAAANDQAILDNVMKQTYLTLLRSARSTTQHTLPSITLMKNSASEIFAFSASSSGGAYQHAFGYIRQLAIHLRNSMKIKSKTKEAYKEVYNWQFAHAVDFWCLVLARDAEKTKEGTGKSELKPLVYPLVQVCLGAIKLMPNSRSHPFHLHVLRSLLHLMKHTQVYIPLAPYILPILTSALSSSSSSKGKGKAGTLKPLDLELHIRAPQQYLKTRVYRESLSEEACYVLAEWLACPAVHASIAFPEIAFPVVSLLRKTLKQSQGGKERESVKALVERMSESVNWIEGRRANVRFGPRETGEVERFGRDVGELVEGESALGRYVKVLRRGRERRREVAEKARRGVGEVVGDMEE